MWRRAEEKEFGKELTYLFLANSGRSIPTLPRIDYLCSKLAALRLARASSRRSVQPFSHSSLR